MSVSDTTTLWFVLLAIGLGTLLIRASFIVGSGRREPSDWMRRVLRPVPAAALSAIVTPAIFLRGDPAAFDPVSPRLWAGLVAAIVAWRTRSPFATIGVGMGTLWLLQWWLGR